MIFKYKMIFFNFQKIRDQITKKFDTFIKNFMFIGQVVLQKL